MIFTLGDKITIIIWTIGDEKIEKIGGDITSRSAPYCIHVAQSHPG